MVGANPRVPLYASIELLRRSILFHEIHSNNLFTDSFKISKISLTILSNSIIVDVPMFVCSFGCLYVTLFITGFLAFRQGY